MCGIELRGLTRHYRGGSRALDGVDLDVGNGELLVLVGPSGSGKTTLLRLIAGLDPPTAGSVRLGGKDLAGVPPHLRNVALVFQNLALYGHLTVAQNLDFGLKNERSEQRGAPRRLADVAAMLGIGHLLDRYPAELSGGEQQRVALGRAIVRQPAALLLDEPLSSLDAPVRRTLRRELKDLQRQLKVPTIYVTHDQAEALALGDRIAVLDSGRLQQVGSPGEIYHRPANRFVAEFFGPQGMNVIAGELEKRNGFQGLCSNGVSIGVPSSVWPDALIDEPVLLGIRPEDMEILPAGDSSECSAVGKVETLEDAGDARYVQLRLGIHERLPAAMDGSPTKLMVRIANAAGGHVPQPGDTIRVRFRYDYVHWFGADGKRIGN